MEELKEFQVFQSGLNIRIYNKIMVSDYKFDVKIFWEHLNNNRKKIIKSCNSKGFLCLNDCLDDCSKYIKKYKKENPIKVENINIKTIN